MDTKLNYHNASTRGLSFVGVGMARRVLARLADGRAVALPDSGQKYINVEEFKVGGWSLHPEISVRFHLAPKAEPFDPVSVLSELRDHGQIHLTQDFRAGRTFFFTFTHPFSIDKDLSELRQFICEKAKEQPRENASQESLTRSE